MSVYFELDGQQFALRDRAAYLWGGYPSGTQHMETKDTVRALLERLPDDCTLEDVLYHLYILQEVERGRADVQAGRLLPHEQVADELRRKWLLGAAG
jgi:hypothetical protein